MGGARDLRLGFIGAGRIAAALAPALNVAGYDITAVASRSDASAEALARRLSSCRALDAPQAVVDSCDLVFLTVPDAAVRGLTASLHWCAGTRVVHTSGVESREALSAAYEAGAETGCLHPLQAFASREAPPSLDGIVWAVEAEDELRATLLEIIDALGGTPVELRAEDRALYHAAAVLASNYVVTLTKMASDLWLRFGWERPAAVQALLPLLRGAVDNLEAQGVPGALTGPIARGDVETVRRHIEALQDAAPELLPAYRELGLQTLPIALAKGGLPDDEANALRALLEQDVVGVKRTGGQR